MSKITVLANNHQVLAVLHRPDNRVATTIAAWKEQMVFRSRLTFLVEKE
jgi:hypothetical protein